MGPAAKGLKGGGAITSLLGAFIQAGGLEEAGDLNLASKRRTAADIRALGKAEFARATQEFASLDEVAEFVRSNISGSQGAGAGDPSSVMRRAQVVGKYKQLALNTLAAGKQAKINRGREAAAVERDALNMQFFFRSQAAGKRRSAISGVISSFAGDFLSLFDKYGETPKAPVSRETVPAPVRVDRGYIY